MSLKHVCLLILVVVSFASVATATPSHSDKASSSQIEAETTSGALMPLSPEMEAEYQSVQEDFASMFGLEVRSNTSLLMQPDGRSYLVFHNSDDLAGRATVTGRTFTPSETPNDGGVIFADNIELSRSGDTVELSTLINSPNKYEAQVVSVTGNFSQIAVESESPGDIGSTVSGGYLSTARRPVDRVFRKPTVGAVAGVLNTSSSDLGGSTAFESMSSEMLPPVFGDSIAPLSLDDTMWMSSEATVQVLVLPEMGGERVYVALDATPVAQETTVSNSGELSGKVVEVSGNYVGGQVSTKQVLVNSLRCAPDSIANPVTGCFPLVTDTTVHTGILMGEDTDIPVVGLSNKKIDGVANPETGEYVIRGRVVSSEQVSFNTTSPAVIVAYDMDRTGDLTITGDAKQKAEQLSNQIRENVTSAITKQAQEKPAQWGSSTPNQKQNAERKQSTATTKTQEQQEQTQSAKRAAKTTTEPMVVEVDSPNEMDSGPSFLDKLGDAFTHILVRIAFGFLAITFALSGILLEIMRGIKKATSSEELSTSGKPAQILLVSSIPMFIGIWLAGGHGIFLLIGAAAILSIVMGSLVYATFEAL
ncbi:hypothetical protein [Haloarchaeobius amylolyticus]|uniref:hypothetical protein n=1 Tax=Haloarchaeobius amylolyticus TaxID=1198296 RepID=UPI002270663B|nr:hypothetical protein [Haloarchaeobius amylolyticus]